MRQQKSGQNILLKLRGIVAVFAQMEGQDNNDFIKGYARVKCDYITHYPRIM